MDKPVSVQFDRTPTKRFHVWKEGRMVGFIVIAAENGNGVLLVPPVHIARRATAIEPNTT